MGIKEQILEILKKYKDGLTIPLLDIKYEIKHGRKLGHALYSYLHRLVGKDLIEPFIPKAKVRMGNVMGYKATEKAFEEDRKERAPELIEITKDLITKGKITDKQEEDLKEICQL